jgi:hypothetical protein
MVGFRVDDVIWIMESWGWTRHWAMETIIQTVDDEDDGANAQMR